MGDGYSRLPRTRPFKLLAGSFNQLDAARE